MDVKIRLGDLLQRVLGDKSEIPLTLLREYDTVSGYIWYFRVKPLDYDRVFVNDDRYELEDGWLNDSQFLGLNQASWGSISNLIGLPGVQIHYQTRKQIQEENAPGKRILIIDYKPYGMN